MARDVPGCGRRPRLEALAITVDDAQRAGQLPGRAETRRPHGHRAGRHGLALVSKDAEFDGYDVNRLW